MDWKLNDSRCCLIKKQKKTFLHPPPENSPHCSELDNILFAMDGHQALTVTLRSWIAQVEKSMDKFEWVKGDSDRGESLSRWVGQNCHICFSIPIPF